MLEQETYADLRVEAIADGVRMVVLNRPERLNALSERIRDELIECLRELQADADVRAVVLTGSGDRAFGAGQDLQEARQLEPDGIAEWVQAWAELYKAVLAFGKPLVAAINGYAVGAALQLALLCDIRVASESARVGMPEVDDAIPCITGTWTMYELIGRGRTAELILTGRMLDASEAHSWGLVSTVVPAERLLEEAIEVATALGRKSPTVIRLNKRWLARLLARNLAATEDFGTVAHTEAFLGGEPQQAMEDFLLKRASGRAT